ncbi:hypothetical protein GCM10022197_42050 [Microlunatus spumicola]|uniref:Uncharacterized protein n=1 Tax=Microlunatus spumicola TaxID=81499 RepID=A0ABP6YFT8_9ACTN
MDKDDRVEPAAGLEDVLAGRDGLVPSVRGMCPTPAAGRTGGLRMPKSVVDTSPP